MIYELAGLRTNKDTTVVFVCPQCLIVPNLAFGSQNADQLVRVLMCPKCGRVLAEWTTVQERDNELSAFAKKVQIGSGCASR
jgi:hypothetical protein